MGNFPFAGRHSLISSLGLHVPDMERALLRAHPSPNHDLSQIISQKIVELLNGIVEAVQIRSGALAINAVQNKNPSGSHVGSADSGVL